MALKRRMRMAVSGCFGVAAALLIVLWARSYAVVTNVQALIGSNRTFQCASNAGRLYFHSYRLETKAEKDEWLSGWWNYHRGSEEFERWTDTSQPVVVPPVFQCELGAYNLPGELVVRFPYWFSVLVVGGLSAALGVRELRRFSLRSLLIAMAVVAVMLGLVVVWKR